MIKLEQQQREELERTIQYVANAQSEFWDHLKSLERLVASYRSDGLTWEADNFDQFDWSIVDADEVLKDVSEQVDHESNMCAARKENH